MMKPFITHLCTLKDKLHNCRTVVIPLNKLKAGVKWLELHKFGYVVYSVAVAAGFNLLDNQYLCSMILKGFQYHKAISSKLCIWIPSLVYIIDHIRLNCKIYLPTRDIIQTCPHTHTHTHTQHTPKCHVDSACAELTRCPGNYITV